MKMQIKALAAACILWTAFSTPALAAGNIDGAKQFVNGVATQVLAIVKDGSGKSAQQEKLLGVVDANIDIDYVAKFVLGKYWRQATTEQQQAYLEAYRPFLKKNYVSKLTRYSGQTFTVGQGRVDSDGSYVVTMKINDPAGQDVSMLYRVVDGAKGTYRISDIVVEGVSLLATQRSEFDSIAQSKGVDGLIDALKKKVASKA
jgi:phospholipid transport system substrate-binding protein